MNKQLSHLDETNTTPTEIVGRITDAYDRVTDYTDSDRYIEDIKDFLSENPFGFKKETFTRDPAVHKAIDDAFYDLFGEDNPYELAYYTAKYSTEESQDVLRKEKWATTIQLKLYMPLTADVFRNDENLNGSDDSEPLFTDELIPYHDIIQEQIQKEKLPEETERGLMHWYGPQDGVNKKVRCAVFSVEERENALWGLADCTLTEELNTAEMENLKDFIAGQASDGWGEGFEQRDIMTEEGTLNVHFWQSKNWSIKTEKEQFPSNLEILDALCTGENVVYGYVYKEDAREEYCLNDSPANMAAFIWEHRDAASVLITNQFDELVAKTNGADIEYCSGEEVDKWLTQELLAICRGEMMPLPSKSAPMADVDAHSFRLDYGMEMTQ